MTDEITAEQQPIHLRLKNSLLTIDVAGGPAVELKASQVDDLIQLLGQIREQMVPAVPEHHDQTKPFRQNLTHWFVDQNLMSGEPALHVRSARFGWLHLGLPKAEGLHMAEWLAKFSSQPDAEPSSKN